MPGVDTTPYHRGFWPTDRRCRARTDGAAAGPGVRLPVSGQTSRFRPNSASRPILLRPLAEWLVMVGLPTLARPAATAEPLVLHRSDRSRAPHSSQAERPA